MTTHLKAAQSSHSVANEPISIVVVSWPSVAEEQEEAKKERQTLIEREPCCIMQTSIIPFALGHKRHCFSNRYKSKKKAFTKYAKKWKDDAGKKSIEKDFAKMARYCQVIRVLAHTQVSHLCFFCLLRSIGQLGFEPVSQALSIGVVKMM